MNSERTATDGPTVTDGRTVIGNRTVTGGVAALLAAGVLGALSRPLGVAAGLTVPVATGLAFLASWFVLGPVYAFALGQVAVAALAGDWPLVYVAGAELSLFALLVAPSLQSARGRRFAAWTLGAAAVLGGLAYGTQLAWGTTWATTLALVGVAALAAYGLHRFERLSTGALTHE